MPVRIPDVPVIVPPVRLTVPTVWFLAPRSSVPPETVKINLQISTMGLQMMGLRDALRMDETLSIPAHMMLNEEFRRPLDEARATQGTKAYLQMRDGPFQPEPFGPRARKKTG